MDQEYLDGRAITISQGKVVGGGTVLNGMVWTRGSAKDYDAWDSLNNLETASKLYKWRWSDLLPYFEKVRPRRAHYRIEMANMTGHRARTTL